MGVPHAKPRHTIAEYLRLEALATEKHEFHDGEILAMSGGAPDHSSGVDPKPISRSTRLAVVVRRLTAAHPRKDQDGHRR